MGTELFYANLPLLDCFLDITDSENFYCAPTDWYVVVTDIINSTEAIESGRYKDVNLLGASCISAVLNIAGKLEIPFVFGGDGAALLIPPSLFSEVREALLVIRQLAKRRFDLDLRVGIVPISIVKAAKYDVKVAKVRVSEHYAQAAFTGAGLTYATQLIKHPETAEFYNYYNRPQSNSKADLSGLECRWRDIPSKYGETVTLMIKVSSGSSEFKNKIYKKLLEDLILIYGSEDLMNPVTEETLHLAFGYKFLRAETSLRSKSSHFWHRILYLTQISLENCLGWLFMNFQIKLADVDWGTYKKNTIATTDYRKFDDMLRMVIVGNQRQRHRLTSYLENYYRNNQLLYGLHVSDRALMTCLVFQRSGHQVHFIDGADGGYTAASKAMKQRTLVYTRLLSKCQETNSY